jgi:hypothetical protein
MSPALPVLVFFLSVTPVVCERHSFDESFAELTRTFTTRDASISTKSYVEVGTSHLNVHKHRHANISQYTVVSSGSSGRAVKGSALLAAGGQWKLSELLLLVFNMIADVFGQADGAFGAGEQLVSMAVSETMFTTVSDTMENAFGSEFFAGTATAGVLLDMRSLSGKLSGFEWNDPAFRPCVTLRRATAMLDIFLDFLSFASGVASEFGDSLLHVPPPANVWLSVGGRIAGGIVWLLQTFALPILEAQSCGAERQAALDADYAAANSAQMAKIQSVKEAACETASSTAHLVVCKQKESDSLPCKEGKLPPTDKLGTPCRPWSPKRKKQCWDWEKEKIVAKQSVCSADSSAQLQTNIISMISEARRSAVEEFRITGEEAITQATASRGGGVGSPQLTGRRDLGHVMGWMSKDSRTGQMVYGISQPNDDEKVQLRKCCTMKGKCMNAAEVERDSDPSLADILVDRCIQWVSTCLQGIAACGVRIDRSRFCTPDYFSELSPCCPRRGPDAEHCSEDLI